VTKSGRFSPAFPAFSAININFYELDGEMTLKLQNEPFIIIYYYSNCIRRKNFGRKNFLTVNYPASKYHDFRIMLLSETEIRAR